MPQRLLTLVNWSVAHYWNLVSGFFFAFLAYFGELKGTFHVMFAAFLFDLALGIWASKKIRKEKFSMDKFFTALFRMGIAGLVVLIFFAADKEMGQEMVSTSNIISYLVTGFLMYSAAKNGYELTGGKLFLKLMQAINKKVEDNTGISIDKLNGEMYDKD